MNVLQILPSLDVGGVETGTIDLARYLVSHGHKAIVISSGGRLVKELEAIKVRHYTLPVNRKSFITMVMMVRAISAIIRSEDIDIVHARSRVPALSAFFAAKLTKRIFITTAHGYYRKHFLSEVMGWGRYVIVASNIMAKHMTADFGVPHDRIRLIPRGVDLSRFAFRDPHSRYSDPFTIGMVARLTPLKGHQDFIKAVGLLVRQIPRLKVVIVGEAPKEKYREDIDLLVRRLGLTKTVEFLGPRQDVASVMTTLDALVCATVTPEAFGRVIIEAQAVGVPVVATRVGGVVDIVEDGRTGLLCQPLDPKDIAEKVLRLYKDRDLWTNLVLEGRKSVEGQYKVETMMTKTLAVYEEALASSNILVIKMSAMGDVILSVPSLRSIRAKFPHAVIKVLVGLQARSVLDGCPYINDRIVCDFKGKDRGAKGFLTLAEELRKHCFDMVIDLQNNKKSHLLSFLTLAPLRYGYDNGKLSFLLNKRIRDDAPYLDPIEHQFRILKAAGARPADKRLELWPSQSDEEAADRILKESWIKPEQGLVGVNVRASARWLTKNWPPGYIAELCDALAKEFNIRVVLTGTKADLECAHRIVKLTRSKPVNVVGRTDILELASLIRRFKVYVTPDSAPMHIAASMGTPFIALFGPTDPARHLPPSDNYVLMYKKDEVRCIPCYSSRCLRNFRCMRKITVDEVLASIRQFLVKKAPEEVRV